MGILKIFGEILGIPYGGDARNGLVIICTGVGENGPELRDVRLQLCETGGSVAGHTPLRSLAVPPTHPIRYALIVWAVV